MRTGAELGRTRAGLHYGDAVVGNFGGEGRLSYTALGDAMNCAARLEGANKYLKTVALVSDEAEEPNQPRRFPADGPDHPFRPRNAGRRVGTRAGHRSEAPCRACPVMGRL